MRGLQLQKIHHLCLKLKHASLARHPRVQVRDTPLYRSIIGLLQREGFLSSVMLGDSFAPFSDTLNSHTLTNITQNNTTTTTQNNTTLTTNNLGVLNDGQRERLKVLEMSRDKLLHLHSILGSDGSSPLPLTNNSSSSQSSSISSINNNNTNNTTTTIDRFADDVILKSLSVLPPVSAVKIPSEFKTPQDLYAVTWNKDKRIWIDLSFNHGKYQPLTLSDMFLVSKGSRKVTVTVDELKAVVHGKKVNPWKGGDVGAVTFIRLDNGDIVTASDAVALGKGGHVLCIAK